MLPFLSVVIPSYNHSRFIEKLADSLFPAMGKEMEVVVVDDGSTDGSADLWRQRYPNVKVIGLLNRGAHNAINTGIKASRGRIISILNSDDEYALERFDDIMSCAPSNSDAWLAFTDIEIINESSDPVECSVTEYYRALRQRCINAPSRELFLYGNVAMTTSNYVFTRKLFDAVGEFRSFRYCHDWDWALRASDIADQVIWIRKPLLKYRVHQSNTISEGNIYQHVAENSTLLAIYLWECNRRQSSSFRALGSPLLRNDSFLPIPTMLILEDIIRGNSVENLLLDVINGRAAARMRDFIKWNDLPLDALLSFNHIRKSHG